MYYVRILAQLIVAIFVIMATVTEFGYARYPPQYMVFAAFVATVFLISKRTTWLPFLGPAAVPVGILKESVPDGADFSTTINVPKCAIRVMYWGSIVKSKNPQTAYGGYTNAGIADVSQGKATLVLKKPTSYSVRGFELKPHVHYRWITARGLLSSVHTVPVNV